MIYTLTLNPAIDHYMLVDKQLINDEVNRANTDYFKAGGKGLNVSRVLEMWNIKNTAIALIGGFTGTYIKEDFSNKETIDFIGINLEGNTRINSKIYSPSQTICVNGNGPIATEETKKEIFSSLKNITSKDIVMICGSSCNGLNKSFLKELCDYIHDKDAKLVIDMESLSIEDIQRLKPSLIKPNRYELSLILKNDFPLETQANTLLENGLSSILVSLGKDGAYYSNGNDIYKVSQPEINAINKVGCGDAMLGTFVGIFDQTQDIEQALKYSVAAGCATASSLEDIKQDEIIKFAEQIQVNKIER